LVESELDHMSSTVKNHYSSAINDDKMQVSFMCPASKDILLNSDDAARVIVSFIEVNILPQVSCGALQASAVPSRKTSKEDTGERVTTAASTSAPTAAEGRRHQGHSQAPSRTL
jgi:hypothetical protein